MKKTKLAALAFTLTVLAVYTVAAQAAVVVVPELKASPANSHLFRVAGADFNVSAAVTLELFNGTDVAYKFTEAISTNDTGKFNAVVVAPTSLSGAYNLTATTYTEEDAYNVTATVKVTLPDMTGPEGPTGANGTQGPQGEQGLVGAKGATGEIANIDAFAAVAGLSIILSVLAVILALFYKKK
jgi:hypothetical protein